MATVKIVTYRIDKWEDWTVGIAVNLNAAKRLAQMAEDDRAKNYDRPSVVLRWDRVQMGVKAPAYWLSQDIGDSPGYVIATAKVYT
jgi:hypothetical protein